MTKQVPSFRIIGIVTPEAARRVMRDCVLLREAGGQVVEAKVTVASWLRTRKAALEDMLAFQRLLEDISAHCPILPAAWGSALVTPHQILGLLVTEPRVLNEALATYGALVQFQVGVSWNPEKVLAAYRGDTGLNEARELGLAGNKLAMGRFIQAFMETRRMALGTAFAAHLSAASRDLIRLPVADETDVLNAVALIDRSGEATLDKAVEAIDSTMSDALKIRYTGPLPALSFASLMVERPDTDKLAQARMVLGVSGDADAGSLQKIYYAMVKAVHTDRSDETSMPPDLAESYRLLRRVAEASARQPGSSGLPLLASIRRDGEVAWAA
jgi:Gas vesicle synthesis protein GvpL/GvpF